MGPDRVYSFIGPLCGAEKLSYYAVSGATDSSG
jgi:hypothetical protein